MLNCSAFMDGEKGQQVLTAVLLTAVILTVSSSSYFWGRNMLDKSRDQRNFEEMENLMRNINKNIMGVSSRGGRRDMSIDLPDDAELRINEAEEGGMDNITLNFVVEGQMMATDQEIAIKGSKGSEAPITQDSDVIVANSEESNGNYLVEFKIYYKNVTVDGEPSSRIDIDATGRLSAISESTDLIINQGPTEQIGDGDFSVNKVEVRIV
ncbi:MAG: hypothetical protein ACLFQ8_03195 [Candidatus Aenigmatarchaeota archaeon]